MCVHTSALPHIVRFVVQLLGDERLERLGVRHCHRRLPHRLPHHVLQLQVSGLCYSTNGFQSRAISFLTCSFPLFLCRTNPTTSECITPSGEDGEPALARGEEGRAAAPTGAVRSKAAAKTVV